MPRQARAVSMNCVIWMLDRATTPDSFGGCPARLLTPLDSRTTPNDPDLEELPREHCTPSVFHRLVCSSLSVAHCFHSHSLRPSPPHRLRPHGRNSRRRSSRTW